MSIYLIRHAQSEFNAVFDPTKPDPMIFDAPITQLGEEQAKKARDAVRALQIEQVIVSPMTRTLQTAAVIFGEDHPFLINPLVREQLSNSCDVGSAPPILAQRYPHLDFDHLDECWWHDGAKDHRGISVEPRAVVQERADRFVTFLKQESVHSTAVVTHGNFIRALTGLQPDNCEVIAFDLS